MNELNILFTSAGRRYTLVAHFRETLKKLGVRGRVVAADMSRLSSASFAADRAEQVPAANSPDYIERLAEICVQHGIRLLIPLIDTELQVLADHKSFLADQGVMVLVSAPEVVKTCTDKRLTGEFFLQQGFCTPRILPMETILASKTAAYPFFLKPAVGSSSIGAMRIDDADALAFFGRRVEGAMLQEYIRGKEYTLDILLDFQGKVETIVPRLRIETRAGEVSKGMTVRHTGLIKAGKRMAESLTGAVGCLTAQCFLTDNQSIMFTEINPRFGGGFPLSVKAGADYPRWLIQTLTGVQPDSIDNWQDGLVMLRYDDAAFVPRSEVGL